MADLVAILDPGETVRQELASRLDSLGIRARPCSDLESFEQSLGGAQDRPACILLDESLAGGGLYDRFPTIVLATSPEPGFVSQALANGAAAVLPKPVVSWSLWKHLDGILRDSPGLKAVMPRNIRLDNGRQIVIRGIQPEDAGIEQDFVRSLSLESKQKRFFFSVKELSQSMLHAFTHPHYPENWALIATIRTGDTEKEIGVARYGPAEAGAGAEFAVVVADDWQGCGVATHLMRELLAVAEPAGITLIEGIVLKENRRMLAFIERLGFVSRPYADDPGVVRVVKVLGG